MKIFLFLTFLIIKVSSREIEIETFTPDPKINSKNFIDYGSLRVSKVRRNEFAVSGDLELKVNCGNEKKVMFEIFERNRGHLVFKTSDKLCKYLQEDLLVIPDLFNPSASTFPQDRPCPLPKSNYTIKRFVVDEGRFKFVLPGNYRARFSISEDERLLAAFDINASIRP